MGNSESSNPIRNLDKRTARREYKSSFVAAIDRYRQIHPEYSNQHKSSKTSYDNNSYKQPWSNGDIKVYVRKRPIFEHEIKAGEFDVISTSANKIVIHDARMHSDMKRQMMNHYEFEFDSVFHEKTSNIEVYTNTAKPLIEIACKGGFATALVYGQTGSGKTFTMSSIYTLAANAIFEELHNNVERFSKTPTVSVSFIEIAGDQIHDLLNAFNSAQLRTANDGSIHAFPLVEPVVNDAEQLLAIIQHGLNIRTTAATGVHDTSSRSHAMLRIYIQRHDIGNSGLIEGTLTLVDLAGSEHRIDSMYHGKERRKETSQINASLMALKECIRARALGILHTAQHIYRKSKLTMALKDSFNLPDARTIVIATVSPASKDTEHSLNTLRHASIMQGQDSGNNNNGHGQEDDPAAGENRFTTGGKLFSEVIGEVNVAAIARKNQQYKKENQGELCQLKTSNGNNIDNKEKQKNNSEVELTEKMKNKLRRMSEAKSFNNLAQEIKEILRKYRAEDSEHQWRRIRQGGGNIIVEEEKNQYHSLAAGQKSQSQSHNRDESDDDKYDNSPTSKSHPSSTGKANNKANNPPTNTEKTTTNTKQRQRENYLDTEESNEYDEDFEQSPINPNSGHTTTNNNHSHSNKSRIREIDSQNNIMNQFGSRAITFEQLYSAIFLPIVVDQIPRELLLKQLEALLQVHQFSKAEIHYHLQRVQQDSQQYDTHSVYSTATNTTVSNTSHPMKVVSTSNNIRPRTPTNPILSARNNTTASVSSNTSTTPSNRPSSASRPLSASRRNSISGSQPSVGSGNSSNNKRPPSPFQRRASTPNRMVSATNTTTTNSNNNKQQPRVTGTSHAVDSYQAAQQKIDDEAELRRQRQLAAKQHREEQEKRKLQQLQQKTSNKSKKPSTTTDSSSSSAAAADEQDYSRQIQKLTEEIDRLTEMLEQEKQLKNTTDQENKLSMAKRYSIKKQLSLAKAELIRQERRKQMAEQGITSSEVVGGQRQRGVGGGGDINASIRTARELEIGIDQCLAENSRIAKQQQQQQQQQSQVQPSMVKSTTAPPVVDLRYSIYENEINGQDAIDLPPQQHIEALHNQPRSRNNNSRPPVVNDPYYPQMADSSSSSSSIVNSNGRVMGYEQDAFISDLGRPIVKRVSSASYRPHGEVDQSSYNSNLDSQAVAGRYNYQQYPNNGTTNGQYTGNVNTLPSEPLHGRKIDYNESNYPNWDDVRITTNHRYINQQQGNNSIVNGQSALPAYQNRR